MLLAQLSRHRGDPVPPPARRWRPCCFGCPSCLVFRFVFRRVERRSLSRSSPCFSVASPLCTAHWDRLSAPRLQSARLPLLSTRGEEGERVYQNAEGGGEGEGVSHFYFYACLLFIYSKCARPLCIGTFLIFAVRVRTVWPRKIRQHTCTGQQSTLRHCLYKHKHTRHFCLCLAKIKVN